MSYQIDAYLERGLPSLRVIDAHSGEARLHWQQPKTANDVEMRQAWQALFRRLMVLSCADCGAPRTQEQLRTGVVRRQSNPSAKETIIVPLSTHQPDRVKGSNVVYLPVRRSGAVR